MLLKRVCLFLAKAEVSPIAAMLHRSAAAECRTVQCRAVNRPCFNDITDAEVDRVVAEALQKVTGRDVHARAEAEWLCTRDAVRRVTSTAIRMRYML